MLPDAPEAFQNFDLSVNSLLVRAHLLCRSIQSHPLDLHQKMNLLEDLDLLLGIEPVPFGISLRLEIAAEGIRPETDQGRTLPQNLGNLAV